MRILVTGCAGFIGSRLAQWILDNVPDAEVFGLDDLSTGFRENVPAGINFRIQPLAATEGWITPIFDEHFDAVFHCAAFAAECLSPFVRKHCYRQNVVSTAALLNRLLSGAGCSRLVFLSSLAVYGRIPSPYKETDVPVPQDPYGVSKLASEMDIRIAGEQHGLDWCVLRLFNVYGPYQSLWSQHRNVFGIWMRAKLEGKPLVVYGDGSQQRAFTYIDDILPTIWDAAVNPKASREVFNAGSSMPVSINDAMRAFGNACLCGDEIEHRPARHEVQSAFCDVSKVRAALAIAESTPLSLGLSRMWAWARNAWERYPERRITLGPSMELTSAPEPSSQSSHS